MWQYLADNWVVVILIPLLVGILGNALSTWVIPAFVKFKSSLYSVITLGAKSARDRIYIMTARGLHEYASSVLLVYFYLFAASVLLWFLGSFYADYLIPTPGDASPAVASCTNLPSTEVWPCIKAQRLKEIRPALIMVSLIAMYVIVKIVIDMLTISLANAALSQYLQQVKKIRPFISDSEFYFIERRFASMTGEEDYKSILKDLYKIETTNKATTD